MYVQYAAISSQLQVLEVELSIVVKNAPLFPFWLVRVVHVLQVSVQKSLTYPFSFACPNFLAASVHFPTRNDMS